MFSIAIETLAFDRGDNIKKYYFTDKKRSMELFLTGVDLVTKPLEMKMKWIWTREKELSVSRSRMYGRMEEPEPLIVCEQHNCSKPRLELIHTLARQTGEARTQGCQPLRLAFEIKVKPSETGANTHQILIQYLYMFI